MYVEKKLTGHQLKMAGAVPDGMGYDPRTEKNLPTLGSWEWIKFGLSELFGVFRRKRTSAVQTN